MNAQVLSRIAQIKHYINTLSGSIASKENTQASVVISQFKQSMIKSDPYEQTNLFILDCLKAKNEKLKQELYEIQSQKKGIEGKLNGLKNCKHHIKQSKIEITITRLTISLNESRKVEYEQAIIHSDYEKIYINSIRGNKYQNYTINIKQIQQFQLKLNLLYICILGEKTHHIIIKFSSQKQAQKWSFCLKYGQMIVKYGNKRDKLFDQKRQENASNVQTITTTISPPPVIPNFLVSPNNNPLLRNSNVRNSLTIPQIPFLNFQGHNKPISPSESMVSQRKNADKSLDKLGDKANQKSQRSLINALNNDGIRSSGTFNIREQTQPNYYKRIDMHRPPNSIRVRGNSNQTEKGTGEANLKVYNPSGPRKQSEDTIKPHINQVYHEKMLEIYRQQQEDLDMKSSVVTPLQIPASYLFDNDTQTSPEKTAKIKLLEQKKKQLLKQSNILPVDKPAFLFDNKVSWMGIQEMQDQNKSKSSNRMSKKGSQFSESGFLASSDNMKKETRQDDQSLHITQRSQEQSPRMPKKSPTYDVPHKVSYANGIIFQLHKVQKTGISSPLIPTKEDTKGEKNNTFGSQTSSQQYSEDHSDPSSHENHTQSQDNNARSQQLKKGIILTKCSQNGFWTHEKIVYLSENENQLCCRDLKDKKIKKIRLQNIKEVQYKQFDKGIIKHIPKIDQDKCFVIRALDEDNKIKNYQFVGNLAEPLQRFATNLKLFVDYYNQL